MTTAKTILITGAARGVGLATAAELDKAGHQLILVARSGNSFDELPEGLKKHKQLTADFADLNAVTDLFESLKKEVSRIDVLVNNLGIYLPKAIGDHDLDDHMRVMDTNFRGPAYFTQLCLPLLKESGHGHIINMSSIAVKNPSAQHALYLASKAAMTGFSAALRTELNALKIRISTLHPGGINTWGDPEPKQLMTPEDMARLLAFMVASPDYMQFDEITVQAI
jgi:NADP-dependent 3-hydroxy acid dehydrogenase YdfG